MSCLIYYIRRDSFYPVFLISSSYIFVSFSIYWTRDILTSSFFLETQVFIFINIMFFSISCVIFDEIVRKFSINNNLELRDNISSIQLFLAVLCIIYIVIRVSSYSISLDSISKIINDIRKEDIVDGTSLITYLLPIIYVIWAYCLIWKREKEPSVTLLYIVLGFLLFIVTIFTTSKQSAFLLLISAFYIISKRKLSSLLLFFAFGMFVFFFFSFILRNGGDGELVSDMKKYMAFYISSPTIAFQEYYFLNQFPESSNLFRIFEKILNTISGSNNLSSLHRGFVNVGVPTNVYTAYSDYVYYSMGTSFLLSFLHGAVSGIMWRLAKNYPWAKVCYGYFAYSIIFVFYHESFITSISYWIQIVFLSILISSFFYKRKAL
ncbi:oligosaccharide repeat unit polymerase [Jinshanibacter sp. LJY008]|uniref:Oligosaccharide repeat unit polymerase n=1 Tax=Limnobaculum eriocheiris TaxID=2897391 RepID=A0A9X1SJE8_9GAMM|nr:O-antigen polymerase [Limnobaculum eriocheiris]MCD1124776.1 oligosaccharide repeat unit polymerase [Limnobaculum eriocheiris]